MAPPLQALYSVHSCWQRRAVNESPRETRARLPRALAIATEGGGSLTLAERHASVPLRRTHSFAPPPPRPGDAGSREPLLLQLVELPLPRTNGSEAVSEAVDEAGSTAAPRPVASLAVKDVPDGAEALLVRLCVHADRTVELACEATLPGAAVESAATDEERATDGDDAVRGEPQASRRARRIISSAAAPRAARLVGGVSGGVQRRPGEQTMRAGLGPPGICERTDVETMRHAHRSSWSRPRTYIELELTEEQASARSCTSEHGGAALSAVSIHGARVVHTFFPRGRCLGDGLTVCGVSVRP